MTIKHTLLISALFLLVFTSCKTKKLQQSINETNTKISDVIIDTKAEMNNRGDDYTLDSVKINGDILSAFVHYSGGCKEHVFKLYSNNITTRSIPPQTTLCLKHTSNQDGCRAVISEEVKFSLKKMDNKNGIVLYFGEGKQVNYNVK